MYDWKQIPNNRKMTETNHGCTMIVPNSELDVIPLSCPICNFLLRDHDDAIEYQKLNCCLECAESWAYPDIERWESGWRPSPTQVKVEINKRNNMPSYIYQVK